MKVGGLALRGQEVAHWSNSRTSRANEEAFLASVRRNLGQGREKRRGEMGGRELEDPVDFFHQMLHVFLIVKVVSNDIGATFTF